MEVNLTRTSLAPTYLTVENQGSRSSKKRLFVWKCWCFSILKILYFLGNFELLENMCHTTRAVGQTLKEKEKYYFLYFWKLVSHGAGDRTNTIKQKEHFSYFYIFYVFCNFFNILKIFLFYFFLENYKGRI